MRLFLYEYASARRDDELPEAIRREGAAMLAALRADAARLAGVTVRTLPPLPLAEEPEAFRAAARAADACLIVAPEFHGLLAERGRWVLEVGGQLLGATPTAIEACADKWRCWQSWQQCQVPTPLTWLPGQPPLAAPPWLRKWRWGAGSQEMKLVQPGEPLPPNRPWLLQEYRAGTPASQSSFLGPAGVCWSMPPGLQHFSPWPDHQYLGGTLPAPPPLQERISSLAGMALQAVMRPGLVGWVGVDVILGEGAEDDRVLEVNARLTTSYLGLRQLTEANLLEPWLQLFAGEQPKAPAWRLGPVHFAADGLPS